jgi:cytochrome c oxidase cbb3-type subunit 3
MSTFWSIWISVISLGVIVAMFLLLRWNLKNYAGVEEGESMDHEFDGIVELNNGMPSWWTKLFYIVIVWGFVYLALFPGLGNWEGLLGWTSSNQGIKNIAEGKAITEQKLEKGEAYLSMLDREYLEANKVFGPIFEAFAKQDIPTLAKDEKAVKIGQRLFIQNCAQCRGSDAGGQRGFPNLTDNDWLYGGSPEQIKHSLLYGRVATGMAAWKEALGGDQGVKAVAEYVLSLSGRPNLDSGLVEQGKAKFAICSACHGADGTGNITLGAPNLTDNIWLYGGTRDKVIESIAEGRAGVMPAWKDILGEEKVHVISAYVYSLSQE